MAVQIRFHMQDRFQKIWRPVPFLKYWMEIVLPADGFYETFPDKRNSEYCPFFTHIYLVSKHKIGQTLIEVQICREDLRIKIIDFGSAVEEDGALTRSLISNISCNLWWVWFIPAISCINWTLFSITIFYSEVNQIYVAKISFHLWLKHSSQNVLVHQNLNSFK